MESLSFLSPSCSGLKSTGKSSSRLPKVLVNYVYLCSEKQELFRVLKDMLKINCFILFRFFFFLLLQKETLPLFRSWNSAINAVVSRFLILSSRLPIWSLNNMAKMDSLRAVASLVHLFNVNAAWVREPTLDPPSSPTTIYLKFGYKGSKLFPHLQIFTRLAT